MLEYKQGTSADFFHDLIANDKSKTKKFSMALGKVISDRLPLIAPDASTESLEQVNENIMHDFIESVNKRVTLDFEGIVENVKSLYAHRVGIAYPDTSIISVENHQEWASGGSKHLNDTDRELLQSKKVHKYHDGIINYLRMEAHNV